MEILESLSPAETYAIKVNGVSTFKEMLKLTLADLLLRKVLISEERKSSDPGENDIALYISTGPNFDVGLPKSHEAVFLDPFQSNRGLEILFSQLIKIAFESGQSRKKYFFRFLMKNEGISNLFYRDIFYRWLGNVALNNNGKIVKTQVDDALTQVRYQLEKLAKTDKAAGLKLLQRIKGNVLLVDGLESDILGEMDAEIDKLLVGRERDSGSGCFAYFGDFSDNYDSFDHTFDSIDADSGGSGCGGDSGCSGCSGCGGCGGCGG